MTIIYGMIGMKGKQMIASTMRPMNIRCKLCGNVYSLMINPEDVILWQAGEGNIQELFFYLSAAERELIISQTCDNCWKELYGENE